MSTNKERAERQHKVSSGEIRISPDGFVENVPHMSDYLREMPERQLLYWANERSRTPIVDFDIATFYKGKRGDWITPDLKKTGILKSRTENLRISQGVPYVVSVTGETPAHKKGRGVYYVDVLRAPDLEDLAQYAEVQSRLMGRRDGARHMRTDRYLDHLTFADSRYGYVGQKRPGYSRVWLDHNSRSAHPRLGEEWVGMIVNRENFQTFYPFLKVQDWQREQVVWSRKSSDSQKSPYILRERFSGIKSLGKSRIPVDSPVSLEENLPTLGATEQAVLARLWNIYWQNQSSRREFINRALTKIWEKR